MQKMAQETPLSDVISGCQVLDARLMSFDPSANQFNSPHYLGWIGLFIRFLHTCSLWYKSNESFLCHNNKAWLDSMHEKPKVWFLLCRKNSGYNIAPKSKCPGKATAERILCRWYSGSWKKETWFTEAVNIAAMILILFWMQTQSYLWIVIFISRYENNTLGKAALWATLPIN